MMVKASLIVFIVFTVIIAWALQRRRGAAAGGFVAKKRAAVRLWFDAAAIAVGITLVTLAGMHWLRLGS
jgi:hypothetical protein